MAADTAEVAAEAAGAAEDLAVEDPAEAAETLVDLAADRAAAAAPPAVGEIFGNLFS